MCNEHEFDLIDNSNIIDFDISDDSLHMNYSGTKKLADNFIAHLNALESSNN